MLNSASIRPRSQWNSPRLAEKGEPPLRPDMKTKRKRRKKKKTTKKSWRQIYILNLCHQSLLEAKKSKGEEVAIQPGGVKEQIASRHDQEQAAPRNPASKLSRRKVAS